MKDREAPGLVCPFPELTLRHSAHTGMYSLCDEDSLRASGVIYPPQEDLTPICFTDPNIFPSSHDSESVIN
jgi:hypothetical protein